MSHHPWIASNNIIVTVTSVSEVIQNGTTSCNTNMVFSHKHFSQASIVVFLHKQGVCSIHFGMLSICLRSIFLY